MTKLKLTVKSDKRIETEARAILSYIIVTNETVKSFAERVGINRRYIYRLFSGEGSYRQQSATASKIIETLKLTSSDLYKLNTGLDKLEELSAHILGGESNGS
ncbi:hypothetical protein [Bacillus thuringiensis]|uniref:hypothetical protein n=1 Tax=Bacillus thuringiensis TaxID=1428 RepID=UPI000A3ACBEE|nr:hypothetical protein [Bacillus thuringiensis]OUA52704.1 hypothetical protein BK785_23480 [Bacillus thuringiensis serovar bolivia]OUA72340.1 hypothetical protein BK787_27830 [Bacillus thuringiensis serovar pahangi]